MRFQNIPKIYPTAKRSYVRGSGLSPCNVMVIGEAPGRKEDEEGIPFVGRSGKLLRSMLKQELGLSENRYYITNAVKTRPPENATPTFKEMMLHRPFLQKEIDIVKPLVIITCGRSALSALLEDPLIPPLAEARKKISPYIFGISKTCAPIILVTYHPAYALRNRKGRLEMEKDLLKIKRLKGYELLTKKVVGAKIEYHNFSKFAGKHFSNGIFLPKRY